MMERWIVIGLLVLSLAWGSHAQNLGLILGITFSAVGVFIGVCIPLFIFLCVFCGVLLASKRSSQPRTVVVQPGPSQHPPPGTYPVQPGVTYPSEEHTYPTAPYPTDSYPAAPYPTDPTLTSEQPPPYSVAAAYPPPHPVDTTDKL